MPTTCPVLLRLNSLLPLPTPAHYWVVVPFTTCLPTHDLPEQTPAFPAPAHRLPYPTWVCHASLPPHTPLPSHAACLYLHCLSCLPRIAGWDRDRTGWNSVQTGPLPEHTTPTTCHLPFPSSPGEQMPPATCLPPHLPACLPPPHHTHTQAGDGSAIIPGRAH